MKVSRPLVFICAHRNFRVRVRVLGRRLTLKGHVWLLHTALSQIVTPQGMQMIILQELLGLMNWARDCHFSHYSCTFAHVIFACSWFYIKTLKSTSFIATAIIRSECYSLGRLKNLQPFASTFESLIYSHTPCSLQLSLVCNKHRVKNSMQQCAEVVHPFVSQYFR